MAKKIVFNIITVVLMSTLLFFFFPVETAESHGSMQDPVSRIYECWLENPETPDTLACKDAIAAGGTQPIYDWNEINQPNANGDSQAVIPDGQLCSGGRGKYAAFDAPRTDWALTFLPDSGTYTFVYDAYVPHNQGYFELYVTNDEYDFTEALKWSDLEYPPFATFIEPPLIDGAYYMEAELPEGKSGRHIIYAIWQRTDSPEAFYSCSDVWFGNSPTPVATAPPACEWPEWDSSIIYEENDMVTYNSQVWRSKWNNGGTEPSTAGTTNPWEFNGDCTSGSTAATPTPVTQQNQGDVDDNGAVDIVDALLVAQYYVGLITSINTTAADTSCDGTIDIIDALLIAQFYVGLISDFC